MMPADPEKAEYWSSEWQRLHIDKQGRLYRPCEWLSQSRDFVLDRRIKCRPDDLSIADARQPVLKWPKVNGAARYQGSFMSDKHNQDWFNIDQTQFVIGGGITSGEWRYWMVAALDASGKTLARREGRFYGHGTDRHLSPGYGQRRLCVRPTRRKVSRTWDFSRSARRSQRTRRPH